MTATPDRDDRRTVVIGAGFAGLSAAARLAGRGVRVLVLDARPRLGGRATALVDKQTGELVDNGQHVMFGCYRETLAFLKLIGAEGNVRIQERLRLPFIARTGARSVLACPDWPAPIHLLAGILAWRALPLRDRLTALRLAPSLLWSRARRRQETSPGVTVRDWLRAHRQSEALVSALWEPLAVAALNQPISDAAADPFVHVLAEMFAPDRRAAAVVLPTKPLDQMYALPARAFIEARGGEVRTGALARIIVEGNELKAVEVRTSGADRSTDTVERIETGSAIAAVPWHAFGRLFPAAPAALQATIANAAAMQSMPIVTVNLWFDRVVMDEEFVGLSGRTVQWIFDKRRVFGEQSSHLSLVVSAAETVAPLSHDELVEIAVREVSDALPSARGAALVRATVVREKQATFSLGLGQPRRPPNGTAIPGLSLAGDWTDTGLPGTIEGAVASGHRAADIVLAQRQHSSSQ